MYNTQELGSLVRHRPDEARARIADAYRRGGNVSKAAELLQVGKRSLDRWITVLGMKAALAGIRSRARKKSDGVR